jgi:hypothetical protein
MDQWFPEYPKAFSDGLAIIIRYGNGAEEIWGYESDIKSAEKVAKEIELGLRSIDYVSMELMRFLNDAGDQLETRGVPPEHVNEYVWEGYRKVLKLFNDLEPKKLLVR